MKIAGSAFSTPAWSAKRDAPSQTRRTWRPSSITARARSTGCRMSLTAGDGAGAQSAPFHHRRVVLDEAVGVERGADAGIEEWIVLEDADRRHAGIQGTAAKGRHAGGERALDSEHGLLAKLNRPGAGAPVDGQGPLRSDQLKSRGPQLLVDPPLGGASLELVAGAEVDKARVLGEPGMDLVDAPEHLLRDVPVVGVALGRGPQLAEVVDLPQRGSEVPADAVAEGTMYWARTGPESAASSCQAAPAASIATR